MVRAHLLRFVGQTNIVPGILKMYLEKETYERAGLVGQPHGVKGKRGLKPRWGMLPPNPPATTSPN